MVNNFSAGNKVSLSRCLQCVSVSGTASAQPSYYHLVSQHKSSKTCTRKGPESKLPEIFDDLFTRANSHDKFSTTNETGMPV